MVYAFDPVHPVARHVAGSSSTETGGVPLQLSGVAPSGAIAGPWQFAWRGGRTDEALTLVVCDASYEETLRLAVRGHSFAPDATLQQRLAELGTFHWFVEAKVGERILRSSLTTCEIR